MALSFRIRVQTFLAKFFSLEIIFMVSFFSLVETKWHKNETNMRLRSETDYVKTVFQQRYFLLLKKQNKQKIAARDAKFAIPLELLHELTDQ